jgi:hypothetical protein
MVHSHNPVSVPAGKHYLGKCICIYVNPTEKVPYKNTVLALCLCIVRCLPVRPPFRYFTSRCIAALVRFRRVSGRRKYGLKAAPTSCIRNRTLRRSLSAILLTRPSFWRGEQCFMQVRNEIRSSWNREGKLQDRLACCSSDASLNI